MAVQENKIHKYFNYLKLLLTSVLALKKEKKKVPFYQQAKQATTTARQFYMH